MMANWIIKPFRQEHADEIISYGMNNILMEIDASFKENRICQADKGNAYTLFVDNKPIVAGSIIVLWQGVAEGWVMANSIFFKRRIDFHQDIIHSIRNNFVCVFLPKWFNNPISHHE